MINHTRKNILFFADKLPPLIGGMEIHAQHFISHFSYCANYDLQVISKDQNGEDVLLVDGNKQPIVWQSGTHDFAPDLIFFNSGAWIEDMLLLKSIFPNAKYVYRTGGNEIVKAPLSRIYHYKHSDRQLFWAQQINAVVDVLVTNSSFTENRLRHLGITCRFDKIIGGADAIYQQHQKDSDKLSFVSAARLVPYKNHLLMLDTFRQLRDRGVDFVLSIYGDGELKDAIRQRIAEYGLEDCVRLYPPLDNHAVAQKIADADYYVQFSSDLKIDVDGGSYIHTEGMGRAIMEAIMSRTFVIAGNAGALSEIIHEGNGILVDTSKPCTIANEIMNVIDRSPRVICKQDFSWQTVMLNYMRLFEDLCAF